MTFNMRNVVEAKGCISIFRKITPSLMLEIASFFFSRTSTMIRFLLLLCIFLPLQTFAQLPPGEGWILMDDGNLVISPFDIQDYYTRERFTDDAKVSIYEADSTTLITKQVIYSVGYLNGKPIVHEAKARVPLLPRIVIKVEKEGYDPFVMAVDLPEEKNLKKGKDGKYHWNKLPRILIQRSILSRQLGEATVTASRLQMVVRGDTLEYNVANLRLSAGSMLDNLIRHLPGAQLSENGRIMVNGEFVEKLTVNGRDFFNGDAMVALRNLPYYTVSKIKVFHNIGTNFATSADSLRALKQANLTMDVRLKKIYSQMWLANFEVGAGSRIHGTWRNVFFGRFFAMRFTDHSSIGIYGIANNVGKNYSATHSGAWREMAAAAAGEPETQSGGIDFSVDGKKTKLKFHTTLNATREKNAVEYNISEQNFFTSGDIFGRNRHENLSHSWRIGWSANLSQTKPAYSFSISPRLNYSRGSGTSAGSSADFDGDPQDAYRMASLDSIFGVAAPSERLAALVINKQQSAGRSKNEELDAGIGINGSFEIPGTHKQLSLSAATNYRRIKDEQLFFAEIETRTNRYNDNRFTLTPYHNFSYSADASYWLFRLNKANFSLSSNLAYAFKHDYTNNERTLRKDGADWDHSAVPDMSTGYAWEYNLRNSYITDRWSDDHCVTWKLNANLPGFRENRTINLSLGLPFNANLSRINDFRGERQRALRKKYLYFTPTFEVTALDYALTGAYQLKRNLPQLSAMLDIYDDALTLYRTVGNPNLRPRETHNFSVKYNDKWKERASWLALSLTHEIMRREITSARTYDRTTGITTSRMENIDGNWWSSANASYGTALDRAKHLNISSGLQYTYANSVSYSGDTSSERPSRLTVRNHRVGGNASASYARGERRIALSARATWNGLTSPMPTFEPMSYVNMAYSLSLTTPLFFGIDFDTDLHLNMRRGYNEPSMNTTEWVWNAALAIKLGQRGQWVVRAVAFDLLHQRSNVTNTINAQGHTEWWSNGVRSYASLHVVYHIKVKPTKKGIE